MKSIVDEQVVYVAEQHSIDSILKTVAKGLVVDHNGTQTISESYFDTFEWSLFAADCILKQCDGSIHLLNKKQDQTITSKTGAERNFFWWELDDSSLKEALKPLTDIRALTEVIQVHTTRKHIDLLNKDRKTVVRLHIDYSIAKGNEKEKELLPLFRVRQIRGYEKVFKNLIARLAKLEMQQLENEHSYLQHTLTTIGRQVFDYTSKFEIDLADNVTVRKSVSDICRFLVRAMDKNFAGVIEDIDSEFLHDYRIAVRRTRSLIGQMKKLIPVEETQFFQNELKWLGSITGPVRDLDVYLLKRQEYRSMLPKHLHQGLDNFFDDLAIERIKRLDDMRDGLTSARYQQFMAAWIRFLDGKDGTTWQMGDEYCQPHAVKLIRKRLTKILKDGGKIQSITPDAQLHRLRIQGKKLRYLLEFYRSFFMEKEVDFFLKQLKRVQNNLGDFNDISVQGEMLSGYLQNMSGRSKRSIYIAAAVGGLVTLLDNRHNRIRQKFEGTFAEFSSEKNVTKFKGMLN